MKQESIVAKWNLFTYNLYEKCKLDVKKPLKGGEMLELVKENKLRERIISQLFLIIQPKSEILIQEKYIGDIPQYHAFIKINQNSEIYHFRYAKYKDDLCLSIIPKYDSYYKIYNRPFDTFIDIDNKNLIDLFFNCHDPAGDEMAIFYTKIKI